MPEEVQLRGILTYGLPLLKFHLFFFLTLTAGLI